MVVRAVLLLCFALTKIAGQEPLLVSAQSGEFSFLDHCRLSREALAMRVRFWEHHFRVAKNRRAATYTVAATSALCLGAYGAYHAGWLNGALPDAYKKELSKQLTQPTEDMQKAAEYARIRAETKHYQRDMVPDTLLGALQREWRWLMATIVAGVVVNKAMDAASPLAAEVRDWLGFNDRVLLTALTMHLLQMIEGFGDVCTTLIHAHQGDGVASDGPHFAPIVQQHCQKLLVHAFGRVLLAYSNLLGALVAYDGLHATLYAQDIAACLEMLNFIGGSLQDGMREDSLLAVLYNHDIRAGILMLAARLRALPWLVNQRDQPGSSYAT